MILLYAVTGPGGTGVDGLASYDAGSIRVLYDERAAAPERNLGEVLRFGRRIQLAAQDQPILPIRFGTTLRDLDELAALVADQSSAWAGQLERLSGQCELIVHLDLPAQRSPESADAPPYTSGADYLKRRAETLHARRSVVEGLLERVRPALRDHRPLPRTDRERLALLVPRQEAGAVRDAVEAWAAETGADAVQVSGPWPPFSFCEEVGR